MSGTRRELLEGSDECLGYLSLLGRYPAHRRQDTLAKKRSTWSSQEAEVGVWCTCQRGRLANQSRISLVSAASRLKRRERQTGRAAANASAIERMRATIE